MIAAITSCTNTSNPSVMIAAGLLAKKAVERGPVPPKPWVKASLAPGSKVVTDYLDDAGLTPYLDKLRFNLVGYGCTTCIGNSGPLSAWRSAKAIKDDDLVTVAVLSGNRNFEGPDQLRRSGPITSPRRRWSSPTPSPARWTSTSRMTRSANGKDGQPVYLKDIWPTQKPRSPRRSTASRSTPRCSARSTATVFEGDERWRSSSPVPTGDLYEWDDSLHLRQEPARTSIGMPRRPGPPVVEIKPGPASWPCWATASRPTTSRRPGRSRSRARRAATSSGTRRSQVSRVQLVWLAPGE